MDDRKNHCVGEYRFVYSCKFDGHINCKYRLYGGDEYCVFNHDDICISASARKDWEDNRKKDLKRTRRNNGEK